MKKVLQEIADLKLIMLQITQKIGIQADAKAPKEWVDYPEFYKMTGCSYSTWNRWLTGKHESPAPIQKQKIFGRWHVHQTEVTKIYAKKQIA